MALPESDLLRLMESLRTAEGVELVRVLAQRILQDLIEAEATAVIGTEVGEHTPDCKIWRDDHRDKLLTAQAGDLELKLPELRSGNLFPSLLERRYRIDEALFALVITQCDSAPVASPPSPGSCTCMEFHRRRYTLR